MRIGQYLYAPEGSDEPPANPPHVVARRDKAGAKAQMVDLGCANGWGKDPNIVVGCEAARHRVESRGEAKCLTRITCRQCGYTYTYDSSD